MTERSIDFEILTQGRLVDLTHRLTPIQIEIMADHPFRECPECGGDGIIGAIIGVRKDGEGAILPIPCDFCEGVGEAFYISNS